MGGPVRVATYNLYLGADLSLLFGHLARETLVTRAAEVQRQLDETAFPRRVDAVADLLAAERPDLLGLQEVTTWWLGDDVLWDFETLLLPALAARGAAYDVVVRQASFRGSGSVPLPDGGEVTMSLAGCNAVLSRRDSAVVVESTAAGTFGAALSVPALEDGGFRIVRGWCAARCSLAGTGFGFVDTHTEAHDAPSRDRQRDELVAVLPEGPLVLVGDFNARPEEVGLPLSVRDAWTEAGRSDEPEVAATSGQAPDLGNPESTLEHRIDYVWVRDVEVAACRRFGAEPRDRSGAGLWPSDHAGVVADLVVG